MDTALIETNSTDLVVKRAKQLSTIIEKGAAKFSDREAEFISCVLDGMILGSNKLIFNSKDTDYFRLTAIIEPENLEETTYLNTQSMNIMYPPHYLLDDEIATNYNTVWVMTPSDSPMAFVVRNYAAPGATMQFNFNPAEKWWDITFDNFMTNDIFISDGDKERAALSTKIEGITVYLVNISAIKGKATDSRNAIVGATEDMVRTSVKMWKLESVRGQVKHEYPIVPITPIIEGIHMNTQPDENDAAVESSSCCSLT